MPARRAAQNSDAANTTRTGKYVPAPFLRALASAGPTNEPAVAISQCANKRAQICAAKEIVQDKRRDCQRSSMANGEKDHKRPEKCRSLSAQQEENSQSLQEKNSPPGFFSPDSDQPYCAGLRDHAGEELARHVVLQQPFAVARKGEWSSNIAIPK